jgi:transcriptional regulator with XRE-family HTH domain
MSETAEVTIGTRIATMRQQQGWTQQALAERIAVSRVAISHIEMDISTPGERTVALLASVFKVTPQALVAGTTYPQAKAERLPTMVAQYTPWEQELALLQNDLGWLERLRGHRRWRKWMEEVRAYWGPRLAAQRERCVDPACREQVAAADQALRSACNQP